MLIRLLSILAVALCCLGPAHAAQPPRVDDPAQFSHQIYTLISQSKFKEVAAQLSDGVGSPERSADLENTLKELEGKTFDFGKKVYDKDYNGALRQIVYYSYVESFGFVYFRFSFKMTSRGWYLTGFQFKESSDELFPKDLIEGP
ncbi:MAG: hypothetical protein NT113_22675 [Hyphomicrobiales bacterium]|jgi:hypothetical protein|nr:hypothetical protein [Hyphomicrobiales bacterium]